MASDDRPRPGQPRGGGPGPCPGRKEPTGPRQVHAAGCRAKKAALDNVFLIFSAFFVFRCGLVCKCSSLYRYAGVCEMQVSFNTGGFKKLPTTSSGDFPTVEFLNKTEGKLATGNKFSDFFDHKKSDDVIFKHHKLPEKNNQKVQAIDVVLREYNILFV